MRAYVTGGSGFVGTWLTRHLADAGDEVVVAPPDVDVTDFPSIASDLLAARSEVVYHLAALADVSRSWEDPAETLRVNATGTLGVLEAARRCPEPPAVLIVSSGEVYGHGSGEPLTEGSPLRPVTPYAASKAAAELLGLQAHLGSGLRVVRARPFNHAGPGQSAAFVVSALARRIVRAERAPGTAVPVGNLSPSRDFTDVRDVVRAYRLLAEHGAAGEVYNVCSGESVAVARVAELLCGFAATPVELVADPALARRPVDVPLVRADAGRLRALTGWEPKIPLEETLRDVLQWWRAQPAD